MPTLSEYLNNFGVKEMLFVALTAIIAVLGREGGRLTRRRRRMS